jgi:uncharacterized DUF497 family protein
MRIEWDDTKELINLRKHGLDFSLAHNILADPLTIIVYDRYENGEHRHHAITTIHWACLVLVHTYPDPDDEENIRIIGLRRATPQERQRYEKGFDDG